MNALIAALTIIAWFVAGVIVFSVVAVIASWIVTFILWLAGVCKVEIERRKFIKRMRKKHDTD